MSLPRDFRIGCGAGFSSDRLDPAVDLARRGHLDALVFECVGERTLAFGHRDLRADPARGYNPLLERRMRAILPLTFPRGTQVITNMGVANPRAAAERTVEVARELGLGGLVVAALLGDDVSEALGPETPLREGMTIGEVGRPFIGANAYLGADEILPALETGADIVITGRVADPSLFVAPLRRHFGWSADDWAHLGPATAVGHLLECAAQVTGGYFADPGYKHVDGLAYVGFPFAEVGADGGACITKLDGTGGRVDERTVKEQLLYEVHDPSRYLTPDVTADFSSVSVAAAGDDRVRVGGAGGAPRPERLKATVAFDGGWLAEAGISYAGEGARERATLAGDIVLERMRRVHGVNAPLRVDHVGVHSLHANAKREVGHPRRERDGRSLHAGDALVTERGRTLDSARSLREGDTPATERGSTPGSARSPHTGNSGDHPGDHSGDPRDVRLRCAMRASSRDEAELLLWEVEALLCCGPSAGGGYRGAVTPSVVTYSASIDRTMVSPRVEVFRA
ncbi:MAG: DUF1446 domain-containing protein [Thiotrichales bacterium]|nr:DUF1446 domain-containing protein [Thiotrichales bacterium]